MPIGTGERQEVTRLADVRRDHLARYEWAAVQLNRRGAKKVVDAGCGVGYGSYVLATHGLDVRGYDRDADAISWARKHFEYPGRTQYLVGQLDEVTHPRDWDAVCAFEILEHLAHPEVALTHFHEMADTLFVSVPNEDVFPFRGRYTHHVRHYTLAEITKLLELNGWDVVDVLHQIDERSEVTREGPGRTLVLEAKRAERFRPIAERKPANEKSRYLLGDTVPRSVAIIALGQSKAQYAAKVGNLGNAKRVFDEVWVINASASVFPADRVFHMDDLRIQEARAVGSPESQVAGMLETFKQLGDTPIYTSRPYSVLGGNQVEYPLEWVLNQTGHCYFEGTPPYVLAFALALGVSEVYLYGMDYARTGQVIRETGKACMEYWIAVAKSAGMTVRISNGSSLLGYNKPDKELYGYDTEWVTIDYDEPSRRWSVGRVPRQPHDVPTPLEMEFRYSHHPELERREAIAKKARELEHLADKLLKQRQNNGDEPDGSQQEE